MNTKTLLALTLLTTIALGPVYATLSPSLAQAQEKGEAKTPKKKTPKAKTKAKAKKKGAKAHTCKEINDHLIAIFAEQKPVPFFTEKDRPVLLKSCQTKAWQKNHPEAITCVMDSKTINEIDGKKECRKPLNKWMRKI